MSSNESEKKIAIDYHATRREDHEDEMEMLANASTKGVQQTNREARTDHADAAYATMAAAGLVTGDFEWPSTRSARIHREASAENRPPEFGGFTIRHNDELRDPELMQRMRDAEDPEKALADRPVGSVAIRETVNDNDALDGSSSVVWLDCGDLETAKTYLEQAGPYFAQPGPGEDDGVYTQREIFVRQPLTRQEPTH